MNFKDLKQKVKNLFKPGKLKREKKIHDKSKKPAISAPKKRPPVVNALLFALRVLWGAVRLILTIVILAGFIGGGLGAGLVYGYIETTSELKASDLIPSKFNTFIYDVDGNVLAELKQNENRVWIDFTDIPKNLINAYIAVEDKRFWDHKGVDFRRFLKSTYNTIISKLKGEDDLQGGSTLTQQMVKNLTGNMKPTIKRKIQEMWQALKLEREGLSKEDILTRYMNTIPMGSTIYGIETAAQAYYGKDVRNLSLANAPAWQVSPTGPLLHSNSDENRRTTWNGLTSSWILFEQGMITGKSTPRPCRRRLILPSPRRGRLPSSIKAICRRSVNLCKGSQRAKSTVRKCRNMV